MYYTLPRYICLMLLCCLWALSAPAAAEPVLVIDPHGHSAAITELMFTPDGQTLISTSFDKTIRFWDVNTGDLRKTLRSQIGVGYEGALMSAALSPDGTLLAVGGFLGPQGREPELTGQIRLFDVDSGKQVGVLSGHDNVVFGLDFSPDGTWLASGSGDRVAAVWDVTPLLTTPGAEARIIALLGGSPNSGPPIYDVAFGANRRTLLTTANWRTLMLYTLKKNPVSVSGMDALEDYYDMEQHRDQVYCVDVAPNGEYIISGGKDGYVLLWDGHGKFLTELGHFQHPVSTVAFADDGSKVVVAGVTGQETYVYAIPSGEKLVSFTRHTDTVEASDFYGSTLVATAGGADNDIYIWNADTGDVVTHITGHAQQAVALGFGPDLRLAIGNTSTEPPDTVIDVPQDFPDYTPLEKVFDVTDMQLVRQVPQDAAFTRAHTRFDDHTLERVSWNVLNIVSGSATESIENHPNYDGMIRAYTYTPDGTIVVGSSYSLKLYDSEGYLLREFVGHTGEIWAVSVSADGRVLVSGSSDQTIKFWNLHTGEHLATLMLTTDNEWICWTPQGYYAASAGGEQYIGWHVNQGRSAAARYYPASVFRPQFHRPELVRQTLLLGNFEAAFQAVRADAQGREQVADVAQLLPPVVRWTVPAPQTLESESATVRIQASIASESPLTLVKILRNGRPLPGTTAQERGLLVGTMMTDIAPAIDQDIELLPGRNDLTIFAANQQSGAVSERRTIIYRRVEFLPDLYVVAIGISDYVGSGLQLTYADDDARAISRALRGQAGKLYRNIQVRELYNAEATQENILEALAWLQQQATPNDVALFFVAAHGTNEDGKYYLLPTDVNPRDISATGVGWQAFADVLSRLPAKVLVLLDTCHSGQLGQDVPMTPRQTDNTEALRALASDEYGVVILAASTGRESSLEHPEWEHGAFTKALLEALEQGLADYSQDSIIDLRELDLYVANRVEALTSGAQHPTTQKPSTISRFPIIRIE